MLGAPGLVDLRGRIPERTAAAPLQRDSLACVCSNIDRAQHALGMQILLENPASYLALEASTISEGVFLRTVVARTGSPSCSTSAMSTRPRSTWASRRCSYIDSFPIEDVREIHLAGLSEEATMTAAAC